MTTGVFLMPYTQDEMRSIIKETVCDALAEFKNITAIQKGHEFERLTRKEAMALLKVKDSKFNELRRKGLVIPQRQGIRTYYDKLQLIDFCKSLEIKN